MDNFFKKLNTAKEAARLAPERKAALREELLQFMERTEAEGVRKPSSERPYIQTSKSLKYILLRPMPIFAAFTILVTLLGGGVSYAAQTSLPGEPLYPVKLLGENLKGDITLSAEARAAWDAQRVANRLEEASVLAAEGQMNATTSAIVASNFDRNAKEADASIRGLQAKGNVTAAANVAAALEAALRAHREIIARFEAGSSTLIITFASLRERVDSQLTSTTELSDSIDSEITASSSLPSVQAAAEGKMTAAANAISEARKFIDRKETKISVDGAAEANAKLQSANDDLARAKANVAAGAYGDAFRAANDAFETAKEAKTLVQVQAELDLKLTKEGNGNDNNATSTENGRRNGRKFGDERSTSTSAVSATSTPAERGNGRDNGKENGKTSGSSDENHGTNNGTNTNINANVNVNAGGDGVNADGAGGFKFEF